jgi:hypothetical protein
MLPSNGSASGPTRFQAPLKHFLSLGGSSSSSSASGGGNSANNEMSSSLTMILTSLCSVDIIVCYQPLLLLVVQLVVIFASPLPLSTTATRTATKPGNTSSEVVNQWVYKCIEQLTGRSIRKFIDLSDPE